MRRFAGYVAALALIGGAAVVGTAPSAEAAVGPIIVVPTLGGSRLVAIPRIFELTLRADIALSQFRARIDRLPTTFR